MILSLLKDVIRSSDTWRRHLDYSDLEGVPDPEPSLGFVSKLLVDEAVRSFFRNTSPDFWLHTDQVDEVPRRELERLLEVYEGHGWIEDPASFHRPPPDLEGISVVSGRRGHHRFEHMRFESGYEPHSDDPARERWLGYSGNRTAHAWLLRHASDADRPWLICLHGLGMGTPYTDFPAFRRDTIYEKLGFNVLWYVKPLHGPRRERTGNHETFSRGWGNLIQVQSQTIWDLRRIISWIRRQHGSKIGAYGLSLGGYAAALLSSLSGDLDIVVAGIPGTDFVDLLKSDVAPPAKGKVDPLLSFWSDARRAMRVVSPLALPCRVPKERRYIFGGLADRVTPPRGVHDLWLHWEKSRIVWYQGSHASFLFERDVTKLLDGAFEDMRAEVRSPARAKSP